MLQAALQNCLPLLLFGLTAYLLLSQIHTPTAQNYLSLLPPLPLPLSAALVVDKCMDMGLLPLGPVPSGKVLVFGDPPLLLLGLSWSWGGPHDPD